MWVSRRTDYAAHAVLALAIADGGPLRLEEIVGVTDAPQSVLAQVMPVLRHAGIVRQPTNQPDIARRDAPGPLAQQDARRN